MRDRERDRLIFSQERETVKRKKERQKETERQRERKTKRERQTYFFTKETKTYKDEKEENFCICASLIYTSCKITIGLKTEF